MKQHDRDWGIQVHLVKGGFLGAQKLSWLKSSGGGLKFGAMGWTTGNMAPRSAPGLRGRGHARLTLNLAPGWPDSLTHLC